MSDETICPACGRDDFDSPMAMKCHHAQKHDERLGVENVECETCGDVFEKRADHVSKLDRHFCSEDCEGEWRSAYLEGERSPRWSRVEVECAWCSAPLQVQPSRAEAYDRQFCDSSCQSEWLSEGQSSDVNTVVKPCSHCGSEIERWPSKFQSDRQFCGHSCFRAWVKDTGMYDGKNNPAWKGGNGSYYGPNWKRQRRKTLKRDGGECAICGLSSDGHNEKYGQGLHVHHITPFREFSDGDYKQANKLDNLISLCRACHEEWEGVHLRPQTDRGPAGGRL